MSAQTFRVSVGQDVGEEIHTALDNWFSENFKPSEQVITDMNWVFEKVWEYIEEKGLYYPRG